MDSALAGVFDSFSKQSFISVLEDVASGSGLDVLTNPYIEGDDILIATT